VKNPYAKLQSGPWSELAQLGWRQLKNNPHGDLEAWLEAISALPEGDGHIQLDRDAPSLGSAAKDPHGVRRQLMKLHPWRKGPLELYGIRIDTEWRSDWKWKRLQPYLRLEGHRVLDIGCGNGYFGLRMLAAGADLVLGIDPTVVFVMQWLAMNKIAPELENYVLPLGIEALPGRTGGFDSVFSMGVLYHRRDPVHHLERLRKLCKPGGQVIVETLVLEGEHGEVLVPEGRYARMRNVHAVPSVPVLMDWLAEAGLENARVLDVSRTTTGEQRSTAWMTFESLPECLDPADDGKTVEGYPAPVRAAVLINLPH
jgi:tRNA (mo5U34)-methyltransferase